MFKQKISIIIPFYNEQWNVIPIVEEVIETLKNDFNWYSFEVILVNDWSKDTTWNDIIHTKELSKNIIWINLNRNYWQSIALDAWLNVSTWEYIFTLDWDWQNDPKDFKKLLDKLLLEDLDIVAWRRHKRKDPWWMLIITKAARLLRKLLINDWVHDSWCTLRVYKKVVINNLYLWWEMHRYIIAISKINWFKIWELKVNHRPRTIWVSKYNWQKSVKGLIDLVYIWFIAKYETRPLHLFWTVWLVNFFIWWLMLIYALFEKIYYWNDLSDNGMTILSIFIVQMWFLFFIFGVVIDIMIRTYYNNSKDKRYIIKEKI